MQWSNKKDIKLTITSSEYELECLNSPILYPSVYLSQPGKYGHTFIKRWRLFPFSRLACDQFCLIGCHRRDTVLLLWWGFKRTAISAFVPPGIQLLCCKRSRPRGEGTQRTTVLGLTIPAHLPADNQCWPPAICAHLGWGIPVSFQRTAPPAGSTWSRSIF